MLLPADAAPFRRYRDTSGETPRPTTWIAPRAWRSVPEPAGPVPAAAAGSGSGPPPRPHFPRSTIPIQERFRERTFLDQLDRATSRVSGLPHTRGSRSSGRRQAGLRARDASGVGCPAGDARWPRPPRWCRPAPGRPASRPATPWGSSSSAKTIDDTRRAMHGFRQSVWLLYGVVNRMYGSTRGRHDLERL